MTSSGSPSDATISPDIDHHDVATVHGLDRPRPPYLDEHQGWAHRGPFERVLGSRLAFAVPAGQLGGQHALNLVDTLSDRGHLTLGLLQFLYAGVEFLVGHRGVLLEPGPGDQPLHSAASTAG